MHQNIKSEVFCWYTDNAKGYLLTFMDQRRYRRFRLKIKRSIIRVMTFCPLKIEMWHFELLLHNHGTREVELWNDQDKRGRRSSDATLRLKDNYVAFGSHWSLLIVAGTFQIGGWSDQIILQCERFADLISMLKPGSECSWFCNVNLRLALY